MGDRLKREMLADEQPRDIHAGPTAAQMREAYPSFVKPVDPYEQHRLMEEHYDGKRARECWQRGAKSQEASARNIAALRAELDRPLSIAEQPHPREWFSSAVRRYR